VPQKKERRSEPTVAPGMDTRRLLEQNADAKDKRRGDYTEVTRLYLDRTPED
jgi:hypothetical protein